MHAQQIYARIKRTSKYNYQNPPDGSAFPVHINASTNWEYCVEADSAGTNYRLKDVELYVVADGKELRISG